MTKPNCIRAALGAALLLASVPAFAQTTHKPARHPRRAAPPTASVPASTANSINTPSTDWSKIEQAPDTDAGPSQGMRPVLNGGHMGMGGAF